MKKISDLQANERESVTKELDAKASMIGFDYYESTLNHIKTKQFGLCDECSKLNFAKTEFRILFAQCDDFEVKLHANEKIIECTGFEKKNSLTLNEMKELAYLIEIDKRKAGF